MYLNTYRKAVAALSNPNLTLDQRDYWTKVKRDYMKGCYKHDNRN